MRIVFVLAVGAAACGDDLGVSINVTHPIPVTQTVISVYESSIVDCEKIEFGDLGPAALEGALVAEQTLDGAGHVVDGDLDGLSRTEPKAIVARGYDQLGALVSAGCEPVGVVSGTVQVELATVLAATVSVVSQDDDPYTLTILATRPDGTVLPARAVSWQVYGPMGTTAIDPSSVTSVASADWQSLAATCTNGNGVARIHPIPPSLVGGFATRVRVSWAAGELPLESALTKTDFSPTLLSPNAEVTRPCAIQIAGTLRRLACLDQIASTPVIRAYTVTASNGRGVLGTPTTVILPALPAPIGVVAIPNGNDREVYVVDADGTLTPLFGATAAAPTTCPGTTPCTGSVTDFQFVPPCGEPENQASLLLRVGVDRVKAMAPRGGVALDLSGFASEMFDEVAFASAGCVTQITPQATKLRRRLVLLDLKKTIPLTGVTSVITRGFYGCSGSGCGRVVLPFAEGGIAFASTATESRLLGTSADATGPAVSAWILLPDPDPTQPDRLLERDRTPFAAIPHRLVAGQLDDDGEYDIVGDLRGQRASTLEIAYSRLAGDQRLAAVSPALPQLVDELLIDDLTGDGQPDLVLVGHGLLGSVGVAVVPTHVAPAATSIVTDRCP